MGSKHLFTGLKFTIFCVFVTVSILHLASGYSVKKVIDMDNFTQTTQESIPAVTNQDDIVVMEGTTDEQTSADEVPYIAVTTEIVRKEDNEILRDAGAVTEKVPFEATANNEVNSTLETTSGVPFVVTVEDEDLSPFVRPITPDPNADPNYPTVNPLPDDFNIADLVDVNATGPVIRGRAQCQCGVPVNRIVGGDPTRIRDFPWTVGLTRGGGRPYCGGTLINNRYIITASHCVDGQSASRISVVLHEQDFNSNADGARPQTIQVESITMHSNYNNKNIDNDVALLRLSQPVPLGAFTPVCLPSSNANDFTGEQATVAGWGATSQGGSTSSHIRKVVVPVISNENCNRNSKYNGKITSNMLCAGLLTTGGKDSCQGDSGGPLIIENGGRKTLIGIVSWGYGCAQAYSPGVYTRVAVYSNWVLANTRGADWCQG